MQLYDFMLHGFVMFLVGKAIYSEKKNFLFDLPGSMICQNLIRKREVAAGVYLIIMHVVGSHKQLRSHLVRQGYLH